MSTYPAFAVEFAPGIDPSVFPDPGDWVPCTVDFTSNTASRVRSRWNTKWGRWAEFSESGAGTAELELDNSDGEMDPDNTSGTHYGSLVAGTWFRILGGTTTADTDVFYGHVTDEGFRLSASQFPDSFVTVSLVDDLEQLANTAMPSGVWSVEVSETDTPDGWWRQGESSSTVAVDSSGNQRHLAYFNGATFNARAGLVSGEADGAIGYDSATDQYAQADFVPPIALGSFVWEFLVEGSGAVLGTAIYAEGVSGSHSLAISINFNSGAVGVDWTDDDGNFDSSSATFDIGDGNPHVVAVKYETADGDIRILIDGADETTVVGSRTGKTLSMRRLRLAGGGYDATLDEVLLYLTPPSDARLAAHSVSAFEPWGSELTSARVTHILDAVGYDATNRNIDTGQTTMQAFDGGGSSAADNLTAAANAERGYVYIDHQDGGKLRFVDRHERWTATASVTSQATFGDSGAEITYDAIELVDDRVINIASVQRSGGATVTITDPTSAGARRRTHSESGLLFETDAESESRANLIVAEKKDRHRVPRTITLRPRKSTHSAWAHVFARKVNDRITVKWRPPYGGTYTYSCWIDGIAHRWDAGTGLETTFHLSPVPYDATAEPYFIVGTSTVSGPARIGY